MKPLTNRELSFFCNQMYASVHSGISSIEAFDIMAEDAGKDDVAILSMIKQNMLQSGSLASAMEDTDLFPEYFTQMIRIGETTGNLEHVLSGLEAHYSREDEIQSAITNAVLYPAFMSAVMIAVVVILLVKVIPVFETVFEQLGAQLTGFAEVMLHAGVLTEKYALTLIIAVAVILILSLWMLKAPQASRLRAYFSEHIGMIQDLRYNIDVSHFAGVLSIMLHSGIPAGDVFVVIDHISQTKKFREHLGTCQKMLSEGNAFGTSLKQCGIFSGIYIRMLSIGDKTGSLEDTLAHIASASEKQVAEKIDKKIHIIEPVFLIFLSAVVAVILLSVMIPLLAIISSM